MDNLNRVDIEDLLLGISSLQISALTHAAKLSPSISSCTLGPKSSLIDRENYQDLDNRSRSPAKELEKPSKTYKETKSIKNSPEKENIIGQKILDVNSLNSSALLRSVEKKRKDEIKRDLHHRDELVKAEQQKRQQIYEKCIQKQEQNHANKLETDKKIIEEAEKYVKSAAEENRKYFENLRREEEKKLKRITFDVITYYQKGFKAAYEKIANLLPNIDKKKFTKMDEYNKLLKVLVVNFENLKQKIRNDNIGPAEVKLSANLLNNIEMIYKKLEQDVEKIKYESRLAEEKQQLDERNRALEELSTIPVQQQQQQQLHQQQQQQQQQQTPTLEMQKAPAPAHIENVEIQQTTSVYNSNTTTAVFTNSERLEFYTDVMNLYNTKMHSYNNLVSDDTMKRQRAAWQKAINIPVNTISAVSPQHLQDKYDKIYNFIIGRAPKTSDCPLTPLEHPLGRDFCLILLSKKMVSQGETTVSSNAQAAFPIAAIIVALWQNVVDFGKLFLACTFKECPYLVPCFIPQTKGQSTEQYLKEIGYRIAEGAIEKQDMYLKRQSGIARLYFAIMITQTRVNFGPHPFGIDNGWKWLCNILSLEPLPDIFATIIFEFLQTTGSNMWYAYGKQFHKILLMMQNQYIGKLSKVDEGGPKARLEVFLSKVLSEGKIDEPAGVLPKNFW